MTNEKEISYPIGSINNFEEFCDALSVCGFSMGGGSDKGIFALIPYTWENQENLDVTAKWHTGDKNTDPWEWRMRVLEDRDDIAYAKLFFGASGFITKEWYQLFYAARRKGESFAEASESGSVSSAAKRIYDQIKSFGALPLHEIKSAGGFCREENHLFERALVELQSRMFITMCGRTRKLNKDGEPFGWNTTVFMTVEDFWAQRNIEIEKVDENFAYEKIAEQILRLNPNAKKTKIDKFILG